ncbi:MAG: pyridoxine 5'-phosphate synthase [Candidatus Cloacimonadota bacterium]|nr:MAG: pyridoxine 5'-phosphate synthase [Candidatus Cloacimonadota bacterium]
MAKKRLGLNIDHVATLRQARMSNEPSPLKAALIAQSLGVEQITVHIRVDRRHIQDEDVRVLKANLNIPLNVEMSTTKEMREFAKKLKPTKVTLVPEKKSEITTEGGLDVIKKARSIKTFVKETQKNKTLISVFIDPDIDMINHTHKLGIDEVELNTGVYAEANSIKTQKIELERLQKAAQHAKSLGLYVAAGHGLTTKNLNPILQIKEIEELNIGHHIIAQSVFMGLDNKIKEIQNLLNVK